MPPSTTTSDSQFAFLISCIRHSDSGKVDFQKVADECEIVSKAAAAKRYERMMKAHGIHQSTSSIKNASVSSSPRTKAAVKTTPKGKKRSFEEYDEKDATGDDDEGLPKGKQAVKSKVEGDSDEIKVKHEVNGYTITEHLLKSEHPEVQSTGYDSGYGKTDGAYDGPSDRMQQYPAYKEETMFTDFLKQEVLEDQKGDVGFGDKHYGAFNMGSGKAAGDSIVIAD